MYSEAVSEGFVDGFNGVSERFDVGLPEYYISAYHE